ncbi:MAG: acetylornithine deacetylase [Pseudomonadota bacterium]
MKQTPRWHNFLSGLVKTPSMSSVRPEFDVGNHEVSTMLANELDQLGFAVSVQSVPGPTPRSNVIATIGHGSGGLVLSGHTDTVPFDETRWSTDPFRATERDGQIFGLGTCDMKGFFVSVVEALRQIDLKKLNKPVIVVGTADEESGMAGAKQLLTEEGTLQADYVVIGEPTNNKPVRIHKGIFMESIRFVGRSGHSSNPKNGLSALEGMHRLIELLIAHREKLKQKKDSSFAVPHPTINFSSIFGGDNPNRICAECELQLDARVIPGLSVAELRQDIRDLATSVAQQRGLEVEFQKLFDGIEAMHTPANSAIVRCCERLTGHPASSVDFATDGPLFRALGMETVIMGPGDIDLAHQPNEYVSIDQLMKCRHNVQHLVHEFCINPT